MNLETPVAVTSQKSFAQSVDYDPFAGGELTRVVPTTEPQRELWLADRLGSDASLAFNESISIRLQGSLDTGALEAALQRLLDRHSALRSNVGPDGTSLCILDQVPLELPVHDFSTLDATARDEAIAARRLAAVETPFSLELDRLFRAELLKLQDDSHVLILTAHHVVCDGWSWGVLVRELGTLYAEQLGHPVEALPPAADFADYAEAQAQQLDSEQQREDEDYWLSRFEGEIPVLDLPTDHPRPAHRSFASLREDVMLDAELVTAVRKLGARHGASLFATLLASFTGLLSRLTHQSRVAVGIPAAGQSVDGNDRLVGHCVNTLPLLFDVDADQPASALFAQAQDTLLDAIDHQRYTFGTLLSQLQIARDPSRLPLISVMFNVDQAFEQEPGAFPGLSVDVESNPRTYENFELFINAVQVRGALKIECQYSTSLFEAATVRQWLGYWRTMLEAMVADAARPLAQVPMLTDAERRQVLETWNDTRVDYPRDVCVHALIEAQVERTPDATAVVFEDRSMTFDALNRAANRLARHLRMLGVGPDQRVAVCAERGFDMVVALVATLKAGGAYVPLDPAYPADRLAYMLGDSRPAVLLTQQALVERLGEAGVPTVALDAADAAWASLDDSNLDGNGLAATNLAYVIYTSGSTGRPKGAMNEHAAVVNRLLWMQDAYGLTGDDAVLQKTPFSFDVSVWEFFLPLMTGARLVMARPEGHKDPVYLQQAIAHYGITTMHFVPSMLHVFLEESAHVAQAASLRRVICSGEALPLSVVQRFHSQLPGVELHNLYGPTEAAVDVTAWHCTPDASATLVPIGRPIANTRIYILDQHGEPVPPGVSGEIHIGGVQVGRGYLDRPELTAERFVHDPFSREPGARMYRTGDLGRWRADGSIEYLGRNDFQVKLRGLRIELGEIEARLEAHPGVAQAVVVAREDRPGDARLVAYVVPRDGGALDSAQLSSHLLQSLPEYMVPSHFVAMEAIPLSPNGKIDRKALPAPVSTASARLYVAPRTELESTIAAAMAHVLGLPDVSVEDDFFSLGGHSLLASQLVARLGRKLDITLSLRTLFDAPTVARLAALIEEREGTGMRKRRARIPRRADQSRAPLSLMQRRLWVLEQIQPGLVTYNTPSAHRLRGAFHHEAFQHAFDEVVRRQLSLRTVITPDGDDAVQQVLDHVDTTIPMDDLSALPRDQREQELHRRIGEMAVVPFQLEVGPLFRVHLFRLAEDEHALFFMAHHVIWDGWSFDLFYSEMAAHYSAFLEGRPSPLPPLPVTYGDFAEWHLQWMQGDELASQLTHWKRHLGGHIEPLRLPQDFPRPAEATGQGDTHWLSLGVDRTEAVRALASRCDATLFMTLLAAYFVLLHRLGGQRDLIVGLPVRNRNDEDLEPVMGFFVNMVPLRMQLDPAMPFTEVVKQVKAAVIESFEYPDVPFEHLVRELGVPRDPSRAPLCQAMFSFQDARQRPTQWGTLKHERIDADQGGAEQDIGLWFLETATELSGGLRYNTDIISEESARRISDRYSALLDALKTDPATAIGDVDLMTADDRATLEQANATHMQLPAEPTVHALLRAQAERTPDRVAISCEGESIRYGDLQRRSDAIAGALHARGVRPGDRVGVCLERSIDLVAGLIAVMKTGAAYVPLDPDYPAERLRFMAEDANLAQVVSRGSLADPMELPGARVLRLDVDAAEIGSAPLVGDAGVAGDAVAYVIYTSGSTGKPKGVQVPHRAAVNFLHSMRHEPGLQEGDRLLAVTTTSFDISVLELFLPLSIGAQVLLATSETAHDGELLVEQLARDGATVMQATPTTWRMLLDSGWTPPAGFKALCGGEPLARDLAARLAPVCELWNMYGPTETTVWSTCARVMPSDVEITVGRPIANTQVYIVDERGQLCAPGIAGELLIAGLGVAHGYLDRAELTDSRFVEDRWGRNVPAGAKVYRTGDLARWRMDGMLEHLGRQDHQIKLRGHRIELGEIEHALMIQPSVGRATVIAREDRPGDVRLVAYVVPMSGATIQSAALITSLRQMLPHYMVPQHIVPLASLPLLPNGKIDRNALPIPLVSMEFEGPAPTPEQIDDPRTAYLAGVWSELLGVPVGPADNFFDLGGHSMLAVEMVSRVARETGVRIKLVRLMVADVSQLAAELPEAMGEEQQEREGGLASRFTRNIKRLFGRPVASAP